MRRHWARLGVVVALVVAASTAAALVLGSSPGVAPNAYGVKKPHQVQVTGLVGSFTVYTQTVNDRLHSDAVELAEAEAAAAVESFGKCASRPQVIGKKSAFPVVVQVTDTPCSSGGVGSETTAWSPHPKQRPARR